ncbi:drebrin isoform X2 [Latimeria chalumnae]|uniref:drebrin isoform X2 n=1 Tax=Latimeria chalumnae TaxID=7897 RepID=UPI00313D6EFA
MTSINLDKYSLSLLTAKEDILNTKSSTNWALFSYEKSNDLKLTDSGAGGVEELAQRFNSRSVMYGFCRVKDPKTGLPRFVLISWVGEEVDEFRRKVCAGHVPALKTFFKESHVFINAHNRKDVTPDSISQIILKISPSLGTMRIPPRVSDTKATVGTNYRKTNAAMEMRRLNRDSFWAQAEKEEEQRKAEERRRMAEERKRYERERMEQEKKEAEERERRIKEKEDMIEEQRKTQARMEAEERRKEKAKWEAQEREHEEEMKARFKRSESIEKAVEAAVLVSQRSMNPREIFRQHERTQSYRSISPTSPLSPKMGKPQRPFLRYQRSLTESSFIFGKPGSPTSPNSFFRSSSVSSSGSNSASLSSPVTSHFRAVSPTSPPSTGSPSPSLPLNAVFPPLASPPNVVSVPLASPPNAMPVPLASPPNAAATQIASPPSAVSAPLASPPNAVSAPLASPPNAVTSPPPVVPTGPARSLNIMSTSLTSRPDTVSSAPASLLNVLSTSPASIPSELSTPSAGILNELSTPPASIPSELSTPPASIPSELSTSPASIPSELSTPPASIPSELSTPPASILSELSTPSAGILSELSISPANSTDKVSMSSCSPNNTNAEPLALQPDTGTVSYTSPMNAVTVSPAEEELISCASPYSDLRSGDVKEETFVLVSPPTTKSIIVTIPPNSTSAPPDSYPDAELVTSVNPYEEETESGHIISPPKEDLGSSSPSQLTINSVTHADPPKAEFTYQPNGGSTPIASQPIMSPEVTGSPSAMGPEAIETHYGTAFDSTASLSDPGYESPASSPETEDTSVTELLNPSPDHLSHCPSSHSAFPMTVNLSQEFTSEDVAVDIGLLQEESTGSECPILVSESQLSKLALLTVEGECSDPEDSLGVAEETEIKEVLEVMKNIVLEQDKAEIKFHAPQVSASIQSSTDSPETSGQAAMALSSGAEHDGSEEQETETEPDQSTMKPEEESPPLNMASPSLL